MKPVTATASPGVQDANPIYLLAAITLGIPILLLILLLGTNPGIQAGAGSNLVTLVVVAASIIAAIFEIKRLVDLPSESDHH